MVSILVLGCTSYYNAQGNARAAYFALPGEVRILPKLFSGVCLS